MEEYNNEDIIFHRPTPICHNLHPQFFKRKIKVEEKVESCIGRETILQKFNIKKAQ